LYGAVNDICLLDVSSYSRHLDRKQAYPFPQSSTCTISVHKVS